MKARCITRVTEGDKTYMPGEIITDVGLKRVESLERSGAAKRIEEEATQEKAKKPKSNRAKDTEEETEE